MHFRLLFSILSIAAFLGALSCKKDDDANAVTPDPPPLDDIVYPSYSRLDSGNYWVYGYYTIDSLGNDLGPASNQYDSAYVEKDTIIRGHTFHTYVSNPLYNGTPARVHLRDSLQYITDDRGNIYFAAQDFDTEFYRKHLVDLSHLISDVDTFALVVKKMADRNKTVTVPAGSFTTSSMRTTWTLNDSLPRAQYPSPRRLNTRYSAEVGLVSETLPFYAMTPTYTERRLLRYRVR